MLGPMKQAPRPQEGGRGFSESHAVASGKHSFPWPTLAERVHAAWISTSGSASASSASSSRRSNASKCEAKVGARDSGSARHHRDQPTHSPSSSEAPRAAPSAATKVGPSMAR
jgi:hypothetical protein